MRKSRLKKLAFLFILSPLTLGGLAGCAGNTETKPVEQKSSVIKVKEGIVNGTVTTSLTGTLKVGTEVEIIAIPNEGYEVDKYFLNDTELTGNTFNAVEGDNIVHATFKASTPDIEFGSVQVMQDSVIDGTVVAKLEDGTVIEKANRRQQVGTKIILEFLGVNECYEIKEVKLNDSSLEVKDGKCEFTVIKGKNFISARFGLINPGKGLVKLDGEVNNALVEISNLNTYVDVETEVTIKVTPEDNYIVKSITVNGETIEESETKNTYIFKVKEGLNTIKVVVTSIADGISIVVPEDWILDDRVTTERYYVQVGDVFKLDVKFEPEGAYDDLIWSLAYDSDSEYIEVKEDGTIKVLKECNSSVTVKVALSSNPENGDRISLVPVSSAEYGVAKLRSDFKQDKLYEVTDSNKSNVVVETKKTNETKSTKTTYDFEAFKDGHSTTKVTDDKGMSTFFYRTIFNDTFYAIHRDSNGDKAVEEATKVTSTNKEELETRLNVFGGIEFIESNYGEKYSGALDYIYETIFGKYSIYDEDNKEDRKKIYDGTTVTSSMEGYKLNTDYTYTDFLGTFNAQIKLDISYSYFYERIDSISYERRDYKLENEGETVTETTPYELTKINASVTYGQKEEDTNNIFDINDYLLTDFTPVIYKNRDDIEASTLKPNGEGKIELNVDETYYIDVKDLVPESGLDDFNELTVECNNKDIINYFSSTSNKAKYYFSPIGEGEGTITFTIGSIVKTINVISKFAPIESVEFDSSVKDSVFINDKIELKANVTPDKGVASDKVTFAIKEGTNTCEASIIEEVGSFKTSYFVTASKSGTVTVIATSVGDPTKTVEKTFTFKETPNVLGSLSNKKYSAQWSEFNMATYGTIDHSFEIQFGENGTSATIKYTTSEEDYYGEGATVKAGNYSATISQNGTNLVLSDVKDLGTSTIAANELPTLNLSITSEGKLENITLTKNGETKTLQESIDLVSNLKGRTFENSTEGLTLSFVEQDGNVKCLITYETGYTTKVTHKFTANIEQSGNKIKLIDIVADTEGSDISILPSTTFTCKVSGGNITSLTYPGYYYDEELTEVL